MSDSRSKNFGKVNSWTAATWIGQRLLRFYKKGFLNFYSKVYFAQAQQPPDEYSTDNCTQPTGQSYVEPNSKQKTEDTTCSNVRVLHT
jgi:hypothetical protein